MSSEKSFGKGVPKSAEHKAAIGRGVRAAYARRRAEGRPVTRSQSHLKAMQAGRSRQAEIRRHEGKVTLSADHRKKIGEGVRRAAAQRRLDKEQAARAGMLDNLYRDRVDKNKAGNRSDDDLPF